MLICFNLSFHLLCFLPLQPPFSLYCPSPGLAPSLVDLFIVFTTLFCSFLLRSPAFDCAKVHLYCQHAVSSFNYIFPVLLKRECVLLSLIPVIPLCFKSPFRFCFRVFDILCCAMRMLTLYLYFCKLQIVQTILLSSWTKQVLSMENG